LFLFFASVKHGTIVNEIREDIGEIHRLAVAQELSLLEQVLSCSPLKSKPADQFRLIDLEVSIVED